MCMCVLMHFFFFIDPTTTHIYTLSLHDALPILLALDRVPIAQIPRRQFERLGWGYAYDVLVRIRRGRRIMDVQLDRKSTRLNSSHPSISYAVFCLKKKKEIRTTYERRC